MVITRSNAVHAVLYLVVALLVVGVVFCVLIHSFLLAAVLAFRRRRRRQSSMGGDDGSIAECQIAKNGRRLGLALAFAVALLSLAGIPCTLGFIAKFHAAASGADDWRGILLGSSWAAASSGFDIACASSQR